MRRSAPPPPYLDDDENELIRILADLTIRGVSPEPQPDLRPVAPPLPRTPSRPNSRLYAYQTPVDQGVTRSWPEAAARTQAVPSASPLRLMPRGKSSRKNRGYAVFFGLDIGAFKSWHDVQPLVIGVSCSLYQGYSTFAQATAAFDYAARVGWTRIIRPSSVLTINSALLRLPNPVSAHDGATPLHPGTEEGGSWYVVYSGMTPGVYGSYLECAINTIGLPSAVHDSFDGKAAALAAFQDATEQGRVKVLTPSYS
ncbi:hypothetical protein C8R46DRAFT_1217836 [Mycena filopes]|nr:hypothetical protein C8R46DRAFT_1217836 [Mycena filopes]